jgi:superfamily II DNA or RNA helicase
VVQLILKKKTIFVIFVKINLKMVNNKKDKIQKQALQAWIKNKYQGTIVMATGSGKTRVGILAADMFSNVLIITPTTNLRDNEWVREYEKWSVAKPKIDIECVQTVYNKLEEYSGYELIIIDEVHSMLSSEYSKVFNLESKARLCLTATIPTNEEYAIKLEELSPVVYNLSLEEAIKEDLISDYKIYNVPISLTRGERYLYSKFNNQFKLAKYALMQYAGRESLLDFANKNQKSNDTIGKLSKKYMVAIMMRKNICYKSRNKIFSALNILQKSSEKSK